MQQSSAQELTAHLFRNEYGKMVASLTRIFGMGQLTIAEDIVQDTLLLALKQWGYNGPPPNPAAWLYTVAKNKAIDYLRRQKNIRKITGDLGYLLESAYTMEATVSHLFLAEEIKDNQLRMIFALCTPVLSKEAQIALILKTLCGFGNQEIASAFLTSTEVINKRLYRAKEKLRQMDSLPALPTGAALTKRLDTVLKSIYLLFNEGYNSTTGKNGLLSHDLCFEAMRLCLLLTENPATNMPQAWSLLALMCFNASRFNSRVDDEGRIVVYARQNRDLWNKDLINKGVECLRESGKAQRLSHYHIEAMIASYYCLSPSFEQTEWQEIFSLYQLLEKMNPSPMVQLNKAIVLAHAGQPKQSIALLLQLHELKNHHLYHATLAHIYNLIGQPLLEEQHLIASVALAKNPKEKFLITERLNALKK